jgi:hypothetical protein
MAGRDGTYPNSKVGIEQGADRIFIDPDGFFNTDSQDITGEQMKELLYKASPCLLQSIQKPVTSTLTTSYANSQKNLITGVDLVIFSTGSNHINMSFWLTSCSAGKQIILALRPGSTTGQSGVIWVSTSGCSIIGGGAGTNVSGFFLRNSSNSQAFAKLECFEDNEWTVTQTLGGYAEA